MLATQPPIEYNTCDRSSSEGGLRIQDLLVMPQKGGFTRYDSPGHLSQDICNGVAEDVKLVTIDE